MLFQVKHELYNFCKKIGGNICKLKKIRNRKKLVLKNCHPKKLVKKLTSLSDIFYTKTTGIVVQ